MQFGPAEKVDERTFRWKFLSLPFKFSCVSDAVVYNDFWWRIEAHRMCKRTANHSYLTGDFFALRCYGRPVNVYPVAGKDKESPVYRQEYQFRIKKGTETVWNVDVIDEFPICKRLWIPGESIHAVMERKDLFDIKAGMFVELHFKDRGEEETEESSDSENEEEEEEEEDKKPLEKQSFELYNDDGDVLDAMRQLLVDVDDCDVTLIVGERKFKAHKVILKARSEVLKRMFQSNMTENVSGEVIITDCCPDAFEIYLRYVYTGKVEQQLTNKTALGLYYIAEKYDATKLLRHCIHYLENNLAIDDIVDVASFVSIHSQEKGLVDVLVELLAKNFKQVCETKNWGDFVGENPVAANSLFERVYEYMLSFA